MSTVTKENVAQLIQYLRAPDGWAQHQIDGWNGGDVWCAAKALLASLDGQPFDIEVKRFYMPGVKVSGRCKGCGEIIARDLGESYLDYPTANKPFDLDLYHDCDGKEDATLRVVLHVTLEVLP